MEPLIAMKTNDSKCCGSSDHLSRRNLLKIAGTASMAWLTPLATLLAAQAEKKHQPARSVIMLWLGGGPSQLETFDPHPGTHIAAGTGSRKTSVPGIELATGLEHTAEVMGDVSLIRSMVSKEGDHERATYNMKTGYRPSPTVVHPSLGAIVCHQLRDENVEIPRHISILSDQWRPRGGYLGAQYDSFQINDPKDRIPDVTPQVSTERMDRRMEALSILEKSFHQGRPANLDEERTLHQAMMRKAEKMMSSEQLKVFDISQATEAEKAAYGNTAFGRGCLAAVRLIEVGVRCVEITLGGWDSHVNNHEVQAGKTKILDPAFAALINDLKQRNLLKHTVVLCGGEFGRTPEINPLGGRDHWPHGFSIAVAGGGFQGGQVIGQTDPSGEKKEPSDPIRVEDIHSTVQQLLGIDPEHEIETPVGRPIVLSEGKIIRSLL